MIKKVIGAALLAWVTRSLVGGMKHRTARRRATADAERARTAPVHTSMPHTSASPISTPPISTPRTTTSAANPAL